jgi:hypothetical protein
MGKSVSGRTAGRSKTEHPWQKKQNVIIDTSLIYFTNFLHEGVYVSPSLSILKT